MARRQLLIATRSPGKQPEIRELLCDVPWQIVFPDEIGIHERSEEVTIETADSFEGNARLKAEYFARLSGLPTAAEDSGIEVMALGGLPGVRSKRFAMETDPARQDDANNAELLRRLAGAPETQRGARYVSVIVFLPDGSGIPHTFRGTCAGRIVVEPRGAGGFGYDPLFFSNDLGKTFGEATREEKASVSHRGRAFRAFAEWLVGRG